MRALTSLLLTLTVAGCASKDQPSPSAVGHEAGAAEEATPVAKTGKALSKRLVDDLLEDWLSAHNQGDLAAYKQLYAGGFAGVKRVGERVVRLDRAGWLEAHAPRFAAPMQVEARQVRVPELRGAVTFEFVERATFDGRRVVVRKRLRFVLDQGAAPRCDTGPGCKFRISREEFLAPAIEIPAYAAERFAFVHEGHLILATEAQAAWAQRAPKLRKRGDFAIAEAPVDAAKLPARLRWSGREVELFDADGRACRGKVGELSLYAGTYPYDIDEVKAEQLFERNAIWLRARVVGAKACRDPLWGRAKGGAKLARAPSPGAAEVAAIEAQASAQFRKLAGYRGYRELAEELGYDRAKDAEGDSRFEVGVVRGPGDRLYAAVAAYQGPLGCNKEAWQLRREGEGVGFHALFAVDQRAGAYVLTPLTEPDNRGTFFPHAVVDIDSDGVVEFVSPTQLVRRVGESWEATDSLSYQQDSDSDLHRTDRRGCP